MEHEAIKKLIVQGGGFLTLEQVKDGFAGEDMEVLEMKLGFLVAKNRIREVTYQSNDGPSKLYYIPRQ